MLLRDKDKQALLNIFSLIDSSIEVWAYGSRVNGTAHEGSDLDLVIRTPNLEKLPIDTFLEIKEKITESNIPILVDVFDWARLPESFHQNIESHHKLLFSNFPSNLNEPPVNYGIA